MAVGVSCRGTGASALGVASVVGVPVAWGVAVSVAPSVAVAVASALGVAVGVGVSVFLPPKTLVVRFANKLAEHARTEEEVLYPAAIVAGDLVRARGARP